MSNDELWKLWMKMQIIGVGVSIILQCSRVLVDCYQKRERKKKEEATTNYIPEMETEELFGMEWPK